MRLQSIEIKGFKSFGDKVIVHFTDGVTGIVGPNGCGKSNIVDAIRWVLGEQKTRILRSDKMENVIFNGTRNRKPGNLAEVSLTFDNHSRRIATDFSEVTITRKLYRSGESEYLINQVPCRLKDITSLFLDTGIGADSYAIMELKMIDEILNDREGSRRTLFEEASGIAKYKVRKKETLAKLEDTDQDLARVEDILFEIDKSSKTLQSQAKKTEKYYQLRDEYRQNSLDLAALNLRSWQAKIDGLQQEEQQAQDEKTQLDARHHQMEADGEQLKLKSLAAEKLWQSRQKATQDHLMNIRNYESEKKLLNEQLKSLGEKQAGLSKSLADDKHHAIALGKQLEGLGNRIESEKAFKTEADAKWSALKERNETARTAAKEAQAQLEQAQRSLKELTQQTHQLEKTIAVQRIQHDSIIEEINRQQNETGSRQNELTHFDEQISNLEIEITRLENDLGVLRFEELAKEQQIESLQLKVEETREQLAETSRIYDAKRNEHELLRAMVESLEGHTEAVRFLKKQQNWARNPQLLSDVLSAKEPWKATIETYLEPVLNYLVVQTFTEARAGVFLLQNQQKGRAHFFVSQESQSSSTFPQVEGYIRAVEVVETDKPFWGLIQQLLGHIYIAEAAQEQFNPETEPLLTQVPGAVVLHPKAHFSGTRNSLSGGSINTFEGKRLGRKRNMDQLVREIDELGSKVGLLKANGENLNQQLEVAKKSLQKQAIEQLHQEIQRKHSQLAVFRSQKDQFAQFIAGAQDHIGSLQAKLEECKAYLLIEEPKYQALQLELQQAQGGLEEFQNRSRVLLEEQQKISSETNAAQVRALQLTNQYDNTFKDFNYKQQQLDTINKRIVLNNQALEETDSALKKLVMSPELSDDKLLSLYEEKEGLEAGVREAEESWLGFRNGLDLLEQDMRLNRKQREQVDELFFQIRERNNQVMMQRNSLLERLSVEFELPVEAILERPCRDDVEEERLRQQVSTMKEKLDNFGPINPMAVEAYKEISERHQFISAQREDLLQAKQSLLDTIKEIDDTAKERFMLCFQTVRENFIRVFRSLFTEEDNCDLILVEPENPLESAIQITAKPKGKRPLTINQLSGGEKTLTAIALLFGIYLYKPAPFCIFDEVDAPLDDTNIDKFNRIIRKFSEESQFILVTHNKRTMETTDVIYGVTMVEQGISRVVPVDLRHLV